MRFCIFETQSPERKEEVRVLSFSSRCTACGEQGSSHLISFAGNKLVALVPVPGVLGFLSQLVGCCLSKCHETYFLCYEFPWEYDSANVKNQSKPCRKSV